MCRFNGRLGVLSLLTSALFTAGCDRPTSEPAVPPPRSASTARSLAGLDRDIRVLLAADIPSCEIKVPGLFDLVDADRRDILYQDAGVPQLTIQFGPGAIAFPELDRVFEVEAVEIVPHSPEPMAVSFEDQRASYAGALTVYRYGENTGGLVNIVDVEDYLVSVVISEVPASFHPEALRVQAVVSRTYAWYQKRMAPPNRRWDLMATESSQMYTGIPWGDGGRQAMEAVRDTSGVVCTWNSPHGERIFCSYFSSTCGGHTQAAGPVKNESSIPPLSGIARCDYCADSRWFSWGPVRMSKKVVTERLRQKYPRFQKLGRIEDIQVVDQTVQGRPVRLRLLDAKKRAIELEAENLRLTVDPTGRELRSTFCTIRSQAGYFVFSEGRGFGHGLGLCQYGADGMARAGANAAYILRYYYPQSRLKRAY
jgi:stage II sporulation protein D